MKKLLCMLPALLIVTYVPIQAQIHQENERLEKAYELIRVLDLATLSDEFAGAIINIILIENPDFKPYTDFMSAFLDEHFKWEDFEEDYANLYAETFTLQELNDLIEFYTSDTGRRYTEVSLELFEKGMMIGQKRSHEIIPELELWASEFIENYMYEEGGGIDSDLIYEIIEGRWDWEHRENMCGIDSFFITSFPDEDLFVLKFDGHEGEEEETTNHYHVEEIFPRFIRAAIEGETRLTEEGDPVVWDLMLMSPDRFCWRRTDWEPVNCTQPIVRCY